MTVDLDTYRRIVEHITLVQRLLLSAQIELSRRITTHDRSKLSASELERYCHATHILESMTYGTPEYEAIRQELLGDALAHHFAHNRHHPEHFADGIDGMNLFDVLEMLVDWMAATKRHADGDIHRSFAVNQQRYDISPQLERIMKNTIPWLDDEFAELTTQADITQRRNSSSFPPASNH
jgi:hypothetical protein